MARNDALLKEVRELREKYPDADKYKRAMVELAITHQHDSVEELYLKARQART